MLDKNDAIEPVVINEDCTIGGALPTFIIGPCAIESKNHCIEMAEAIAEITSKHNVPVIFKASYDKANRTSLNSYRGPGIEAGLEILASAKEKTDLPVTSDVHDEMQIRHASEILDLLQIPAFLCRQTDMIVAAAESQKPTSIKKGQFLAPWDMKHVVNKYHEAGGKKIILIERGTTFGYNNLVSDLRSLPIMRDLGVPVIYDGTHSIQMPGGEGGTSGGSGHLAPGQMRAAMAVGCEGIFLEVHDSPADAKSDGPNMVPLKRLDSLLNQLLLIHQAIGRPSPGRKTDFL